MKKLLYVFVFLIPIFAAAQEKKNISVEWIYGSESSAITKMPGIVWLENGKAFVFDSRGTDEEHIFLLYDPSSNTSENLFDMKKALVNLKKYLGDKCPKNLSMPVDIARNGGAALYVFNGDIFMLDFKTAEFQKITSTKEVEINVKFSPDASKISFVRSNNLFVYSIKLKNEIMLTKDGSEEILNGTLSWVYWEEIFGRSDNAYWWSPDSKSIAFLRTDESPVATMYYQDFKPYVPDVIKQKYPKTGEPNPIVKVGIVNLESQKIIWPDFSDKPYEYIIRVNWLPNSEEIALQLMNREQTQLDLIFVNSASGKMKRIFTETDPGWVNINDDLAFIKNGKEFLWVSERSGFAHIFRFDSNGNLINQVTKGDWAVASSGGSAYWVRGAISAVDEKTETIYFTAQEKDPKEKHLYSTKYDGAGFKKLTDGNFTHRINFSADAKFYLDTFSNISTPPVMNLYKNTGSLVNDFAAYDSVKINQLNLQRPEIFSIKTKDGFELPAEIMKPHDFDPTKKYPLIVYVYGGPSAPQVLNNWRGSIYFDQVLLNNGFLVAIIDPRTAAAISKKIENLLLKNMSGEIELADLVEGINWFKKQSYIDSTRIGVWGWSGGGTFTFNAMTNTKLFKAGIAVAGVTDWRYYDTKFGEMAMKTPLTNPDGYEKTSLVSKAKNLHGRLMIVHGSYDDNVHLQNAFAFIDELIKANKIFDMMIYPMRKHGISDTPARIHLYNTMLEFWKKNL